jgi:hypothetical protein
MPTTRSRTKRKPIGSLTPPEKHLLFTGKCWPSRGTWKEYGELAFRPFMLISPGGRDELRALWEANKESLIEEWRQAGHKRRCWADIEFSKKRRNDYGQAES